MWSMLVLLVVNVGTIDSLVDLGILRKTYSSPVTVSMILIIKLTLKKLVFLLAFGMPLIAPVVLADTLVIPDIDVTQQTADPVGDKGFGVSFHQQDVEHSGATSVTDYLAQHSLIQVKSHSASQSQKTLSIHGFGDNAGLNTLYMIDGMPDISVSEIGPNLNTLLPGTLSQLTVLPGSYGSLYGDQAIGGVVNITTDIAPEPVADLTMSIGNHHQYGTSLLASQQGSSGWGARFGGSLMTNDHYLPHNQQQDYLMNATVSHQGDVNQSSASLIAYHTSLEMPQSQTWGAPATTTTSTTTNESQGYVMQANNDASWGDLWHWCSHVLWFDDDASSTFLSSDNTQDSIAVSNAITDHRFINAGVMVNLDQYEANNSKINDGSHEVVSTAYGRLTLPLHQDIKFHLGGRYAWQEIDATPNSGSAVDQTNHVLVNEQSVDWTPKNSWRFYLRRDTNYRLPKGKEELWTSDGSVNDLAVQTGVAYEAGLAFHNDHHEAQLGVYQLNLDNELAYSVLPLPYGELTNLPPTQRNGIDAATQWSLTPSWKTSLEMSVVDPTFRSGLYEGNQIPAVSRFHGGVGLTYQQPYQHWFITAQETYHAKQYASDDDANSEPEMPGYWLTNLNAKKTWRVVSLGASVDNVFNKHYVRYAQYQSFDGTIAYYPSDGVTVLATVIVHLDALS